MNSRSSCSRKASEPLTRPSTSSVNPRVPRGPRFSPVRNQSLPGVQQCFWRIACSAGLLVILSGFAYAGNAPAWMHSLVGVPVPQHDDKTVAVLLYADEVVNIQSADKVRTTVRRAYKILRPDGRDLGFVVVPFEARTKINDLHGWCIPAEGKDYEVKDKDGAEVSLPKVAGAELISDVRAKVIQIPAPDPGNIIGYEYEREEQPYALQDLWHFQSTLPVRESHYTLQLPPGWEFKSTFLNTPEIKPVQSGNLWQWSVNDVKAVRREDDMPPWNGVAGRMIISYYPSGGAVPGKTFVDWRQMGMWYSSLTSGRAEASPALKQKVASLTGSMPQVLDKVRAIARFAQRDIRYVAIELGIGGWQPHPAQEVFEHQYGDCKDKATLMMAMLREIGVDSYYVVINTERGSVTPEVQAHMGAFNHAIIAVKLPAGVSDPSFHSMLQHPKLGNLLFFDPTNETTPFGEIGGYLQSNYGLLVAQDGGELVQLPKQPGAMNSIQRRAKLTLTPEGSLVGDIEETRLGDRAAQQRDALRSVTKDADKIKPIETLLSHSLSSFQITKALVENFHESSLPFRYQYSIVAPGYAKTAGDLILVRPRVVGSKSSAVLETKEPRQFPVEFDGPALDTDTFEIALPQGFAVDELPPPVDLAYSFATYHSKTEAVGNVLRYTRSFEIKELSVPLSKVEELKGFYRRIAGDERNTAVLKPVSH